MPAEDSPPSTPLIWFEVFFSFLTKHKGGVAILVNFICGTSVNLRTSLQAVAIKVISLYKMTICSLYLPPN